MALITHNGLVFLHDVCKIANQLNIEGLIFEPNEGRIRGVNEETSILILDQRNLNDYFSDFDMVCINRIPHFLNRLSLVLQTQKSVNVELLTQNIVQSTSAEPLTVVVSIMLQSGSINVDYRCAGAGIIKAPKRLKNDREPVAIFKLNQDNINLLQKMTSAMSSGVSAKDQILSIDFFNPDLKIASSDSIGDSCSFKIESEDFECLEEENISKKYPLQHILSCIKLSEVPVFNIKPNGFLQTKISQLELNILIIPKANLQ